MDIFLAEICQYSELHARRLQVVQYLRAVDVLQFLYRFQLHDDFAVTHEIGAVRFAKRMPFVRYLYLTFTLIRYASQPKLILQRILIHSLQETASQFLMHGKYRSANIIRLLLV